MTAEAEAIKGIKETIFEQFDNVISERFYAIEGSVGDNLEKMNFAFRAGRILPTGLREVKLGNYVFELYAITDGINLFLSENLKGDSLNLDLEYSNKEAHGSYVERPRSFIFSDGKIFVQKDMLDDGAYLTTLQNHFPYAYTQLLLQTESMRYQMIDKIVDRLARLFVTLK